MFFALCGKFSDFLREQWQEAFTSKGMDHAVQEALNPETVNFFGLQVSPSLYTAIGLSVAMMIAAVIIRIIVVPRFKKNPRGLQLLLESMITYFDKSAAETVHKQANFVGPYIWICALFIAGGTLIELFGVRPALASVNTCFACGIMTFFVINICAVRERGTLGRLKRYRNPMNIITDLSVPLSLSLRLFGSIMSGFIIMEILYSIVFTKFVIPTVVSLITTFFHAVLQAYLFATLTTIFVGEAIED